MSRIDSGAATHVGRRPNNEDSYCQKPELGFFAVADGLGGHEGGEVASQLVLSTVADFLTSQEGQPQPATPVPAELSGGAESLIVRAVRLAHHEVHVRQSGRLSMMASTITAVLLSAGDAVVCNLGDSRTFLVRGGLLRRLTRDHTVLAEMEEAGLDTSNPFALMHRNSLTGAVGMEASVDPECCRVTVQPGDVLVLASDGLYEPVSPEVMVPLLAKGGSAQEMAERLVAEAYDRGGTDNITGIVVRVLENG
ncbi:PP2C family protein-serine/threonine phosphatase [Archangium lansingense]|uniref:Protein phosphatase 2C domain-containing protein n=1 Tax=Archangium lansingense TaxID=2995310 RepID=A0ABT3ZVL5_9BACT|nr:protein phosphatase 2C domain-containing protein [Archangium lansinium]MCY1073433.1 protein phosphatase 2C domain-containing protein [Archangium lansinium]